MNSTIGLPSTIIAAMMVVSSVASANEADPGRLCLSEIPDGVEADLNAAAAEKLSRLKLRLPGWLRETNTPSASVAFIDEGVVQWSFVCGEMKEGQNATLETRYNTASIAKPVVAEIMLRVAAQGRAGLDEPMAEHWLDPDIAGDPRAEALTPRIALAHQTGFANWRRMTDGKLMFRWDPGTQTGYSGEGIRYVTRYLEQKLNTPFEAIAARLLFDPAGMQHSSFIAEPEIRDAIAWGRQSNNEWVEPAFNDEPLGAGSVWITSADYARFLVSVMLNAGITSAQIAERFSINRDEISQWCGEGKTPIDVCPENMGFGVGWYIYKYADHTLFAHSGSNFVDKSLAVFVPERKTGFVALTNGENGKEAISRIARVLYDNEDFYALEGY